MSDRPAIVMVSYTHPGQVREHNEDAIFTDVKAGLALLADGMGGYSAGEVASGIAVSLMSKSLLAHLESARALEKIDQVTGRTQAAALMLREIQEANRGIFHAAQAKSEYAGMGTTLVAALFYADRVCLAHVGDSRCYRLRHGKLEQLTHDHSLLQEQIDFGLISPDQARYSMHKNLLTRALGIEETVEAEINEYHIQADDSYVLCSDGLTDMVEPDSLAQILRSPTDDLSAKAQRMIQLANQAGGRDNISVILVHIPPGFLPNESSGGGWWQRWLPGGSSK